MYESFTELGGILIKTDSGLGWPENLKGTIDKPLSSIPLTHYNTPDGYFSWKHPDLTINDNVHGIGIFWMVFTPAGMDYYTEETAVIVVPVQH